MSAVLVAERRAEVQTLSRPDMEAAIAAACERIAPLWPLKHFVAVNPFLGFTAQDFGETCAAMRRVARVDMLMPRAFYARAVTDGTIGDADIAAALDTSPLWGTITELKQRLTQTQATTATPARGVVATVAEVLDTLAADNHQASRTSFMIDEISKWCAAHFDEGQSAWRLPLRALAPYPAWRTAMRHDRNPEVMGIAGFRVAVAAMSSDPVEAIAQVVKAQGIPPGAVTDYLHRALFDIAGWAGYARYRVWDNALYGRADPTLVHLLAVRVVWGYTLFLDRTDVAFAAAWHDAMAAAAALPEGGSLTDDPDCALRALFQDAYEHAYRRRFLASLSAHLAASPPPSPARPAIQAAFCIDVRSEVYRRALERVCPEAQTTGFAGFFGFPIEYVPIGRTTGGAQCPVLLRPAFTVCEAVHGASAEEETGVLGLRLMRRRAAKAWKSFKLAAVASFTFVETVGLTFAAKLASDSAGLTRTVSDPNIDGLDRDVAARVGPRIAPQIVGGRATGFDADQRLAMAEAVLRAMSMTDVSARLVLLAGHGSTTVNNPHASGLDCGACGGHTGEANARTAAAILNDPDVRAGLVGRGIALPDDTWFVGCLHDTTTDDVRVFDADTVPPGHAPDMARLADVLAQSTLAARRERAPALGIEGANAERRVVARSRDWAQVRPEWGLAGNAAFIAAPRARTRGLDLAGRAFLHDYDWRQDREFATLELIMTAPMVVASWINLSYYGAAVNQRAFGSGDKTLHNVVGQLGVLEGNAGDLKVGLPWQSVHDGTRLVHEPLRLSVFIEGPVDAIDAIIAKHKSVRDLVENRWIHLFAIEDDGRTILSREGRASWRPAV